MNTAGTRRRPSSWSARAGPSTLPPPGHARAGAGASSARRSTGAAPGPGPATAGSSPPRSAGRAHGARRVLDPWTLRRSARLRSCLCSSVSTLCICTAPPVPLRLWTAERHKGMDHMLHGIYGWAVTRPAQAVVWNTRGSCCHFSGCEKRYIFQI